MSTSSRHSASVGNVLGWINSNDFPWTFPLPPWAPRRSRRLRRLRIVARRRMTAYRVAGQGWPRTLVQALAWPVISFAKAARSFSHYPAPPGTGPAGRAGLVARRWWLQFAHNLLIEDQAALFFHLPAHRARPFAFITDREHVSLALLSKELRQGFPDIHLKNPFARFCADYDLPTALAFMTGRGATVDLSLPIPRADLFLKLANSGLGEGAEIIPRSPDDDAWIGFDGVRLTAADLPVYAARRLGERPWIFQERLQNAPSWSGFTPGALATVRVVTARSQPSARPELLAAFLRCPRTGSMVDNLCAGNLGSSIDPPTGTLSSGRDWIDVYTSHDRHPDTGAPLTGVILPGWPEIRDLALHAHACAGNWLSIGWDITLTPRGPVLVEANLTWTIPPFAPIEDSRYIEIMESVFPR